MTLETLKQKYNKLHELVKKNYPLADYVFYYGTKEEYDEFNNEALQLVAETNTQEV